jgi:predicted GNAT superfamily acetyltransferase
VLREEDVLAAASGAMTDLTSTGTVLVRDDAFRDALADTRRRIALRVAVPPDLGSLKRSHPELIDGWRSGIRAAIIPALAAGFTVVGFSDGAYLLERGPLIESET